MFIHELSFVITCRYFPVIIPFFDPSADCLDRLSSVLKVRQAGFCFRHIGWFSCGCSQLMGSGKSSFLNISILSQEQAEEMLAALNDRQDVQRIQDSQNKPLRYRVLDAFAVSAGAQAGKKMVDFGFMIASGGLSEISSISEVLRSLLGRDDANPSVTV